MKTLILMLVSTGCLAGPFADLGIGYAFNSCLYSSWSSSYSNGQINTDIGCSKSPLGNVAIGYKFKDSGFSVQAEHWSSLVQKDYGLNVVSVKYHFEFFK
jgi:hypothetical protein